MDEGTPGSGRMAEAQDDGDDSSSGGSDGGNNAGGNGAAAISVTRMTVTE